MSTTTSFPPEPPQITTFRTWFVENGGYFHPQVYYHTEPTGFSIRAISDIGADEEVVRCPFGLAVTKDVARRALDAILSEDGETQLELDGWNERQLVCAYIVVHWIPGLAATNGHLLLHRPYLDTLPPPSTLLTPLFFTPPELELFKGTNVYGATRDRKTVLEKEWEGCRHDLSKASWVEEFTWPRYLTAATYLSSRAFPSSILSPTPSLSAPPPSSSPDRPSSESDSYPILIPGIDSLNHKRAQAVTWKVVKGPSLKSNTNTENLSISLILHTPTPSQTELFNNYGPKPNAELILGYGFSIPFNPDDSIVLKLPGYDERWSIRLPPANTANEGEAEGMQTLWEDVFRATEWDPEANEFEILEDEWEGVEDLEGMVKELVGRFPSDVPQFGCEGGGGGGEGEGEERRPREEVLVMLKDYLQGQRAIGRGMLRFCEDMKGKVKAAIAALDLDNGS